MRPNVGERLQRLLAVLAWLAEREPVDDYGTVRATIDELAERFDLPPERLRKELELAAMCGAPPFTADTTIELIVDDDGVSARIPTYLARPPRFDRREGVAVLTAGQAMLAAGPPDAEGALRSALTKLAATLGVEVDEVRVEVDRPARVDELRQAVEDRRRLHVTYHSAWRDEISERDIDPLLVHHTDRDWYVDAFDHRSGEVRKFRVDRIRDLTSTGDTFVPQSVPDEPTPFRPGPDARRVRLALPAEAAWIAETYRVSDVVELDDTGFEVTLTVAGTTWLERLLLRAGPEAKVLEPDDLADLGRSAAERLLALYA